MIHRKRASVIYLVIQRNDVVLLIDNITTCNFHLVVILMRFKGIENVSKRRTLICSTVTVVNMERTCFTSIKEREDFFNRTLV